jgi:hypothetical protein
VIGITLLTLLAWYRTWTSRVDKQRKPEPPPLESFNAIERASA